MFCGQSNDQLHVFDPENCTTNRNFRFQTNGNEAKAMANNNETSTALQVLLHHCPTKQRKHRNRKKVMRNQLSGISIIYCAEWFWCDICSWFGSVCVFLPFLPICSRSHLNFFALLSNIKVELFFGIYLLRSFFLVGVRVRVRKYRPLHQLWFCVRGYCYMTEL